MCEIGIIVRVGNREYETWLGGCVCRVLVETYPDDPAEGVARVVEAHAEQLDRLGRWVRKILLEVLEEKGGGSGG